MPAGSILVADDDAAIRTVLNQALSRAGYEVRSTGNAATLWRWVSQGDGDLIITDVLLPDESAFDLLPRIKKARPDLPVLVMSAQNTFMTAIRASERGAYEYLPKPFDLKELISIVGRALSEPKEKTRQPAKVEDFESIPLVGRSPAMQEIYRVLALGAGETASARLTTDSNSCKSNGLGRYSKAPRWVAFTAVISVDWALMTTTRRSGRSLRMRGTRSRPFSSGITTSVMTRSPSPWLTQRHSVAALPVDRTS